MANVITNVGLNKTAEKVGGVGTVANFDYVAIGTGTTAASAGDTALEAEITTGGGERVQVTPTVSSNILTLTNTFNFTSDFAVTEAGILNASSGGDLYAHSVFSAVNVSNGDSFQITFNVTYSA